MALIVLNKILITVKITEIIWVVLVTLFTSMDSTLNTPIHVQGCIIPEETHFIILGRTQTAPVQCLIVIKNGKKVYEGFKKGFCSVGEMPYLTNN